MWTWACEQAEIFLGSFDDMDGICQEYSLPLLTKFLLMWQNILPCVYGWMNHKWTFWMKIYMKMLFVEKVWTTQVDEQGFKGLGIHYKSIVP